MPQPESADLFRQPLAQRIDLRHPLAVLASRLPWAQIEAALAPHFARQVREGRAVAQTDLFGPSIQVAGAGVAAAGRPRLAEQLEQVTLLSEDTGVKPKQVIVDLGFRDVDADNPGVEIIHRGKSKSLTNQQRRWLKRRQAVEPAIGHLKHDNAMDRCWLQGATGDALHAVLCAAGYNIRWLLRAIVRLGLKGLFTPVFVLLATLATALATAMGTGQPGSGRLGGSVG